MKICDVKELVSKLDNMSYAEFAKQVIQLKHFWSSMSIGAVCTGKG